MNFSLNDLNLTYPILVGLILGLSWLFKVQQRIAVLEMEVKLTKEFQENHNTSINSKLDNLQKSFDTIANRLMK